MTIIGGPGEGHATMTGIGRYGKSSRMRKKKSGFKTSSSTPAKDDDGYADSEESSNEGRNRKTADWYTIMDDDRVSLLDDQFGVKRLHDDLLPMCHLDQGKDVQALLANFQ